MVGKRCLACPRKPVQQQPGPIRPGEAFDKAIEIRIGIDARQVIGLSTGLRTLRPERPVSLRTQRAVDELNQGASRYAANTTSIE
jgi:hypothetical protein